MYYTYVLMSEQDEKFYTGFTKDLKLRFEQHNKGQVESTKNRRPFKLIYYEACLEKAEDYQLSFKLILSVNDFVILTSFIFYRILWILI